MHLSGYRRPRTGAPGRRGARSLVQALRLGPGAPPAHLLLTEGVRAGWELGALALAAPVLAAEPRGDGHTVLVVPGLFGGDLSTSTLRAYLRFLGYEVSGWELGTNLGPTEAVVSGLRRRLAELTDRSGGRVSLLGWSLGGLYAHELARASPSRVRQVVTLGSPLRLARRRARTTSRLFDRFSNLQVAPALLARPWSEEGSLRVPATAVYTRSDGVVAWRSCLLEPGASRENVEVYGSHYGLAHNPTVLHVLADRLAQAAGAWRPFEPGPLLKPLYP